MRFSFRKKNIKAQEPLNNGAVPWLMASFVLVALPHLNRLPIWLTVFIVTVLGYKIATLKYPRIAPSQFTILLLTFASLIGILAEYVHLISRNAGMSLLVTMLALKLLEAKHYRDGMIMIGVTYFLIVTHFLYGQSIPIATFMFFAVGFITWSLIHINQGPENIAWQNKLRLSSSLVVSALPLMLVLFVLFPRIPGPLWGLPEDAEGATTGLSDEMTPGQISQLVLSDEVAFRATFANAVPPPSQLYWRAIVFWEYDGETWRPKRKQHYKDSGFTDYQLRGTPREYTITLEPHQKHWLFTLDITVPDGYANFPSAYKVTLDRDLQLQTDKPVTTLIEYTLRSYPEYTFGKTLGLDERIRALQLPAYNPRTFALARSWQAETQDTKLLVERALRMFNERFTYTLEPPLLGKHAVDEFLFATQRGFCEHFASSFVFLMRALGIPARVVTGYQGGEINPIGDYMLVRQADAHAWAEVWLEDQGWVRIDPTRAVSPTRIEQGLDAAIPLNENPRRYLLRKQLKLLDQVSLVWDSINNSWNKWVLGYDPEMQRLLLSRLGFGRVGVYSMVLVLTVCVIIIIGIIGFISFNHKTQNQHDKAHRYYLTLCKKLAKQGYPRQKYEGPNDYLQRIASANPTLATVLTPVIELYIHCHYGLSQSRQDVQRLRRSVQQFPRTTAHA